MDCPIWSNVEPHFIMLMFLFLVLVIIFLVFYIVKCRHQLFRLDEIIERVTDSKMAVEFDKLRKEIQEIKDNLGRNEK
jgi:hypothetical protein